MFDYIELFCNAAQCSIDTKNLGIFGASHFSQGGVNYFTLDNMESTAVDKALNKGREGFYGWLGLGGLFFNGTLN